MIDTLEEKLEACRKHIESECWLGFNGSPYTQDQAKELENYMQRKAYEAYWEIFGKCPYGTNDTEMEPKYK